jgi:hypothetical protein
MDKHLQQLLHITGQSNAKMSALSSSIGKIKFIKDLINEVEELNLDSVSRVKIKLWLDKHLKIIEAE